MPRHADKRILPYRPDQMYDLVADVGSYPEFLPWCAAARVRGTEDRGDHDLMEADLVISFRVFRERFASRVTLWHGGRRIDTEYIDGPFKYLKSHWSFAPAANGGCEVSFDVDFEFRNRVLQSVIGVVFNDAMRRIVAAFEARADALYAGSVRKAVSQ